MGLVVGAAVLLLLAEPDLGTAIAILILVGAMLVVSGTPLRVLAAVAGGTVVLVLMVVVDRALPARPPAHVPESMGRLRRARASRRCSR